MQMMQIALSMAFIGLLAIVNTSARADVPAGKLGDAPASFVVQANPEISKRYAPLKKLYSTNKLDGAKILASLRTLDQASDDPLKTVDILVNKLLMKTIDPQGEHRFTADFSNAKGLEWLAPILRYTYEDDSGEMFYDQANRELRSGKPSKEIEEWTKQMRSALSRLPRFEGHTFRGVRWSQKQIDQMLQVGGEMKEAGFLSTSLSPQTAFKFARLNADRDTGRFLPDGRQAVIMIALGKTGRPVSKFAYLHMDEREILFANGSRWKVLARSDVFEDSELRSAAIVAVLQEQ